MGGRVRVRFRQLLPPTVQLLRALSHGPATPLNASVYDTLVLLFWLHVAPGSHVASISNSAARKLRENSFA